MVDESLLANSGNRSERQEQSSVTALLDNAMDSFKYGLIQAPVSGLTQLVDRAVGTHLQDTVQWFKAPEKADLGSAAWYGQILGGTGASMLHFGALHRLVGTGAAARLETSAAYGLKTSAPYVAKSMATGLAFGTLFSPVDNRLSGEDFWQAKLANAGITSLTFGTLTAGAIGLRSTGNKLLSNDIVANGLAGVPAGIVDSDLRAIATHGRLANWDERIESVAAMAAGGAMAGGINRLHERVAPTTGIRGVRTVEEMSKLADSTRSTGHPERYALDKQQALLPRADELLRTNPQEWYNRATAELRRNIESSQHMSIAQRKLLVSGMQEMAFGLEAIASRPNNHRPIMTIYGSARIQPGTFDYELVRYIAGRAVQHGYDVQTGGGPGIMEAANRGAYEALKPVYDSTGKLTGYDGNSIGIVIKLPFENGGTNGVGNGYQTLSVLARNFYTRAEMLNQAGPGGVFVVGKGGVGTGAEALNTITQLQTNKMAPAPVFFLGSRNWKSLDNVFKSMERSTMISPGDRNLYRIVNDPADIFSGITPLPTAEKPAAPTTTAPHAVR